MTGELSQCELLNSHSKTMRAIAENMRNIRGACRDTCPQADAAWSRVITALADEANALFAASLDQNVIETQARADAWATRKAEAGAEHSRV